MKGQIGVDLLSITCLFLAHVSQVFRGSLAGVLLHVRDTRETRARHPRNRCEPDTKCRGFMEEDSTYYPLIVSSIYSEDLSRVNSTISLFLNKIF